jgi:soluble lytic murein transglycosylase
VKKILSPIFLLTFLISSCSTKQVKLVPPPVAERMDVVRNSLVSKADIKLNDDSEELAKAYLEAMSEESAGHKKQACEAFEQLYDHKNLPIRDAALVHAMANCDYSASDLKDIWAKASVASYLKELYFETSRSLAAQKKLEDYEAEFSFALIPFKPIQNDRKKLINRAIEIAEKKEDAEKLKLYREKLNELSPMHIEEITNQNIYSVARDFETNRNFDRARELYLQIINGEFTIEEKVKAYNAYRTSFKVARDLKTFLLKTEEMEKFLKAEMEKEPKEMNGEGEGNKSEKIIQAWAESKIALARAVWTEHKNSEARALLDELIESKKGTSNQQAQAQYLYGSLHLENKENKEALKRFEKAAAFKITDSNLLENIQWSVVWNSWLLKEDTKIQNHVENFTKKSTNQAFISKLTYWKAKSLQRMKKHDEANAVFTALNATDPFGYYGILSTIEINKPLLPLTPSIINKEQTGNLLLDWLIAVGEKTFSQKALKEIDSQFKTTEEREKAMSLYYLTEWYQGGMRQIYNFKQSARNMMTEKYINVVFPVPYFQTVETLSQKYGVPRELIYSITRQESAFVPSERSWADAFGLMQMIPEKASELSKKYKIPYKDFNDLYNPDTNLEMGTALLKELRKKFNGKFAQTVASYNASDAAIKVWEKERFNGNYIEFIESIPYEETRNYIKLVFRNYITYKRLMSKEEFILDKDFFAKPFN